MANYSGVSFLYSTSNVATFDLYGVGLSSYTAATTPAVLEMIGVDFLYSTSDVATFDLYGVGLSSYTGATTPATFILYGVEFPYSVPNVPDAKFTPDVTTWTWTTLRPQLPVKVFAPLTSGSFDTLPPLFTAPVNARIPLTNYQWQSAIPEFLATAQIAIPLTENDWSELPALWYARFTASVTTTDFGFLSNAPMVVFRFDALSNITDFAFEVLTPLPYREMRLIKMPYTDWACESLSIAVATGAKIEPPITPVNWQSLTPVIPAQPAVTQWDWHENSPIFLATYSQEIPVTTFGFDVLIPQFTQRQLVTKEFQYQFKCAVEWQNTHGFGAPIQFGQRYAFQCLAEFRRRYPFRTQVKAEFSHANLFEITDRYFIEFNHQIPFESPTEFTYLIPIIGEIQTLFGQIHGFEIAAQERTQFTFNYPFYIPTEFTQVIAFVSQQKTEIEQGYLFEISSLELVALHTQYLFTMPTEFGQEIPFTYQIKTEWSQSHSFAVNTDELTEFTSAYLMTLPTEFSHTLAFTGQMQTEFRQDYLFVITDLEWTEFTQQLPFQMTVELSQQIPFLYQAKTEFSQGILFEVSDLNFTELSAGYLFEIPTEFAQQYPVSYQAKIEWEQIHSFAVDNKELTEFEVNYLTTLPVEFSQQLPISYQSKIEWSQSHFFIVDNKEQTEFRVNYLTTLPVEFSQQLPISYQSKIEWSQSHFFIVDNKEQTEFRVHYLTTLPVEFGQQLPFNYQTKIEWEQIHSFIVDNKEWTEFRVAYLTTLPVEFSQQLPFTTQYKTEWLSGYGFEVSPLERLEFGKSYPFGMVVEISQEFGFICEIRLEFSQIHPFTEVEKAEFSQVYTFEIEEYSPIYFGIGLPFYGYEPSVLTISNEMYLLVRGKRVSFLDVNLRTDWDSYLWTGGISLAGIEDYTNCPPGEAIQLFLQESQYHLIVEKRSLSKDEGMPNLKISVTTPTRLKSKISKTWDAVMAHTACEEIAGQAIIWNTVNWQIPAGRLTFQNTTQIDALKKITGAAGAIVTSDRLGNLTVKPRFSVTPAKWQIALPNQTFSGLIDRLSYSEEYLEKERFNAVIITDGQTSQTTEKKYSGEFVEMQGYHLLRIFAEPWAEYSEFAIEHIGHSSVGIKYLGVTYREEIETLEFREKASTKYPIKLVQEYRWKYRDLGSLIWSEDSRELSSAITGTSVLCVKYLTRVHEFKVTYSVCRPEISQFLIKVQDATSQAFRIECRRGLPIYSYAPEIADPLCCTYPVALERGRNVLDEFENLVPITQESIYRADAVIGDIVETYGFEGRWRGMVTGIEHSLSESGVLITRQAIYRVSQ